MIIKEIPNFNLEQIADSGQCFRWKKISDNDLISNYIGDSSNGSNTYKILAYGRCLLATQKEGKIYFDCDEEEFNSIWHKYFDLDTDYAAVIENIDENDEFLKMAALYAGGIRILRQELWEMVISYIISQNNNIPRIKNSIEKLCMEFGEAVNEDEYGFPTAAGLKSLDIKNFAGMGLGYRDRYIVDFLKNEFDNVAAELSNKDYASSMKYLMGFNGIGKKVANCICLYGLHKVEACPIDTWMKRIIDDEYSGIMPAWMSDKYAGIYQQYAFYYKRLINGKA